MIPAFRRRSASFVVHFELCVSNMYPQIQRNWIRCHETEFISYSVVSPSCSWREAVRGQCAGSQVLASTMWESGVCGKSGGRDQTQVIRCGGKHLYPLSCPCRTQESTHREDSRRTLTGRTLGEHSQGGLQESTHREDFPLSLLECLTPLGKTSLAPWLTAHHPGFSECCTLEHVS